MVIADPVAHADITQSERVAAGRGKRARTLIADPPFADSAMARLAASTSVKVLVNRPFCLRP
jgi:hypothetical protein